MRDSILFSAGLAFETIKVQQFISILLCGTVAYSLFSIVGYRARKIPLWLCIVGVLGGATAGCFGFCNVVPRLAHLAVIFENGFVLLVIWDIAIGVLLLKAAKKVT